LIIFLSPFFVMILIGSISTLLHAQSTSCGEIVINAVETAGESCQIIGRNQVCYGHFIAEAEPQPQVTNFSFAQVGDIVDVNDVQSVRVNGLNEITGQWGIVMMRLQLNVPDTLPGENVTFVMFGDTEITQANAVEGVASNPSPMQAFYLKAGIGGATCAEAPESGLLVQTPEGVGEILLRINEVDIMLGSTVFFQILEEADSSAMYVSTLEGAAFVEADETLQVAVAGTSLRIPVAVDGDKVSASSPPNSPTAYNAEAMSRLPVELLPRRINIASALTNGQVELVRERIVSGEPLCDALFLPDCDSLPPAFRDGLNTSIEQSFSADNDNEVTFNDNDDSEDNDNQIAVDDGLNDDNDADDVGGGNGDTGSSGNNSGNNSDDIGSDDGSNNNDNTNDDGGGGSDDNDNTNDDGGGGSDDNDNTNDDDDDNRGRGRGGRDD